MTDRWDRVKELFQHAAITEGITVRVAVNFLPEQSRIEVGKFVLRDTRRVAVRIERRR